MSLVATSLKLPSDLKKRIARLAEETGESPHALMVRALAHHVESAELHAEFVAEALDADAGMSASGEGYAMDDVHRYFREKLRGKPVRRPRPVRWRK